MQLFFTHFMSSEELISTDQSVQMYFTVSVFCQTLIFIVTFQGKYLRKITFYKSKIFLLLQTFFLNSVTLALFQG